MTKLAIRFVYVLASFLMGASLAHAKCEGTEKVVRLAVLAGGPTTAQAFLAKELQTEFQRSLNGKWCISYVPPQEGTTPLSILRDGKSDLSLITLDSLSIAAPLHRVFELPFAFRDRLALQKFLVSKAATPLREWRAQGVRSMALVPFGLEQIGGRKALFLPLDIAGVRFALETQQATRPMIPQLRATGRVVALADIKKTIEENRADAQMARWQVFDLSKTSSLHMGYTVSNHAVVGVQILASEKWASELKAADLSTLLRAIKRATQLFSTRQEARENGTMESIMSSGKTVYLMTRQQRSAWREALEPITQSYSVLPGGEDILEGIKKAHILP